VPAWAGEVTLAAPMYPNLPITHGFEDTRQAHGFLRCTLFVLGAQRRS